MTEQNQQTIEPFQNQQPERNLTETQQPYARLLIDQALRAMLTENI